MIAEAGPEDMKQVAAGKAALMEVVKRTQTFEFPYCELLQLRTITCQLTVFSLVPQRSDIGKHNIPVFRTAIPEMLDKARRSAKAKAGPSKRARNGRGGQNEVASVWAHARHLFK